jgi:protein-S-isoprenylcysteine O-methyltransferase Ste14
VIRALAVAVFALGWIPIFLCRSETLRDRLAVVGAGERRWIWLTVGTVSAHVTWVELVLTTAPARVAPPWRLALAIGVFAAGLAWWAWARHRLVAFGRMLDPAAPPPELIVGGPFAVVRHPLALGMLVAALGLALAVRSAVAWATFAAVAGCLVTRCRQEEAVLRRRFGDAYARYAARTPRLVPFAW